jgi:hypothetical protein
MDLSQLANDAVALLSQHAEQLKQVGWRIPQGIAFAGGQALYKQAAELWQKLRQQEAANPFLKPNLDDFQAKPEDTRRQGALSLGLEKLLESDPALAKELAALLAGVAGGVRVQTIHGNVANAPQGDQHIGTQTNNL